MDLLALDGALRRRGGILDERQDERRQQPPLRDPERSVARCSDRVGVVAPIGPGRRREHQTPETAVAVLDVAEPVAQHLLLTRCQAALGVIRDVRRGLRREEERLLLPHDLHLGEMPLLLHEAELAQLLTNVGVLVADAHEDAVERARLDALAQLHRLQALGGVHAHPFQPRVVLLLHDLLVLRQTVGVERLLPRGVEGHRGALLVLDGRSPRLPGHLRLLRLAALAVILLLLRTRKTQCQGQGGGERARTRWEVTEPQM